MSMKVGYVDKNSSIKQVNFHLYQDNKCDKETVLLPIIPTLNYSKIRAGKNTFISWKRAHPTRSTLRQEFLVRNCLSSTF